MEHLPPQCYELPGLGYEVPKRLLFVPVLPLISPIRSSFADRNSGKHMLAGSIPLDIHRGFSLLGPAIGAPAAVLALEPLLAAGDIREVILFGTAGALTTQVSSIEIGHVVCPSKSISEDFTSRAYGSEEVGICQDSPFSESFSDSLKAADLIVHHGAVWSTDTPYLESPDKALLYSSRGALAVEMEFAAVRQLCENYTVNLACCFLISDLLGNTRTLGFTDAKFKQARAKIQQGLCDFLRA